MSEVRYLMTQKQLNRYRIISLVIEGKVTVTEAAEDLKLSERQVKRLKKGVKEHGPGFLIHGNTGRKPSHAIPEKLKETIISLKQKEPYAEANFCHFKELLEEREKIEISYTPLYKILTEVGIKSPKTRRKTRGHHRRKRKRREGTLIQMDATPFKWFGTDEKYTLHGAIDDATGKIVGLFMAKNECLMGYFTVTRQMLLQFGIPVSLYTDRHSIFVSPKADKLSIEEQLDGKVVNETQFGRAMSELGVTMHKARSAAAKGRVERLWDTLQSRLPVEFKLAGISSVEDANLFLSRYIEKFNSKFAVDPAEPESMFRPVPDKHFVDYILCVKQERSLDNGHVFSFYGKHFQVIDKGASIPPRSRVKVLVSSEFGVKVQYRKIVYDVVPYIKPKKKSAAKTDGQKNVYRPPDEHYYKYGHVLWPKLSFDQSNQEILEMLMEIFFNKYA
jgi:transposase